MCYSARILEPNDRIVRWIPKWYRKKEEEEDDLRLFLGGSGRQKGKLVTIPLGREDFRGKGPEDFMKKDYRFKMLKTIGFKTPILVSPKKEINQENGFLLGIKARASRPTAIDIAGCVKIIAIAEYDGVICPIVAIYGDANVSLKGDITENFLFKMNGKKIDIFKE